tara:strand:- start:274 stop:1137 length:864 start_codon:yes stop_codon:yes gene_type:complete
MINILCTSKPGDGLLCYSYEHCCYLNSIGIKSQVVIVTHHKFTKKDYINSIKEKYLFCKNLIFNNHTPSSKDITLILGRSMMTLPFKDKKDYTQEQLLTMHLLFSDKLIALYSENQHDLWKPALEYFKTKKIYNLCDYDVYPNGEGQQYEKMINFEVYKPVINNIQFDYLFLGTNDVYYNEILQHINNYKSHAILTYNEKYIKMDYNNIFAPVKNLLGLFKTYVYTKTYFDPAPRLLQECKWLGKEVIYLRDKNIKDGGPVYMNRPVPTKKIYQDNINILVNMIKAR